MFRKAIWLAALSVAGALVALPLSRAREIRQHPTAAQQAALDAQEAAAEAKWKAQQPELEAWEKKGKPYIPWANKASDLPQAGIPAFPGAQGGGMYTMGGRGGKVFVVTNLNDSGPGSFREAAESVGPRIVVFNVAGVIHTETPVEIRAPYITIEGQTAPGDGIVLSGPRQVEIDTHDAIVRYMRFRRGYTDSLLRDDAFGGDPVGNVIVDHCSASWGMDENLSMYKHIYTPADGSKFKKLPTPNITIQWCISSEALNPDNHAFGATWGGTNDTFHHNLLACNTGRNPSIGMGGDFNFLNNTLFNWRHRTVDGGDDTTRANIINNYYEPGPVTPNAPIRYRIVKGETNRGKNVPKHFGKFYVTGNIVEGNEKVTADNWNGGVQAIDLEDAGSEDTAPTSQPAKQLALVTLSPELRTEMYSDKKFPMTEVTIQPAQEAHELVLAGAGATLPKRDAVDLRVAEMVRTGKVTYKDGIITDISQIGGFPEYKGTPYSYPTNDGIPDWWKTKYNLPLNDPTVASADANGDGYTNIEEYLNGTDPTKKVAWNNPENNVNTLTADKLQEAAK